MHPRESPRRKLVVAVEEDKRKRKGRTHVFSCEVRGGRPLGKRHWVFGPET